MITPDRPPGPSTGTDHELATLTVLARSRKLRQAAPTRTLSAMTGRSSAAARPTGPPPGPNGSRAHGSISPGVKPSEAAQNRVRSPTRWMHSRSVLSAAPSADKISVRLEPGSALTRRSVSPCSRVSWRRAEESIVWPDSSAITSSGCVSAGRRSATTRPWRSTTIRSASRNIWSMSWQASRIVVPCSRRLMISSSTWADSLTPRLAVGSSRASSRGRRPMARATATSWRWPPDSPRTLRVVSHSGMRSSLSSSPAAAWKRVSDSMSRFGSWPSMMLAAMSRLSHSARSCQTTATPSRAAPPGSGGTRLPPR